MADPMSATMIMSNLAKFMGPSVLGWLSSRNAANAQKRAGTTLADMALSEEGRARETEKYLNDFISQATTDQMGGLLGTADTAAGGIEGAAQRGVGYLDPYMRAGQGAATTLADLVNAPEERFSGIDLTMDPSYQFRLQEGTNALQRSAAARGILQSTGTAKALQNYGQQAASQEYQAAYQRALDTFKANQTGRQQRMQSLSDLAQLGGRSAGYAGQLGLEGYTSAGKLRTGAAETAGGWGIGSANTQLGITGRYGDIARNMALGRAQATAGSQLGTGNTWANFWGQTGQNLGDWLQTNPFGGGRGGVQGGDYGTDAAAAHDAIGRLYKYGIQG